MIVPIPAIDLIDGKCVRLTKGDYNSMKVYSNDPVAMAKNFENMGFKRLHLVDLDGARTSHVVNLDVLKGITSQTSLKVDFGGGIKSDADIEAVFECGAQWATVGSVAVTQPELFDSWIARYGAKRLILGADVKDGCISINGWKEESKTTLFDFLDEYITGKGIRNVLCTDISRDGTLNGPAVELYRSIRKAYRQCRLIASGGVRDIHDLEELNSAKIPAVVFGKAIYEGKLSLKDVTKKFITRNKTK